MTVPWMMNCPHSDDSWCLDCVATLAAERDRLESALQTERGKLEAADAANDALARDAARYRWLRALNHDREYMTSGLPWVVSVQQEWAMPTLRPLVLERLDAAIDAAMKGLA